MLFVSLESEILLQYFQPCKLIQIRNRRFRVENIAIYGAGGFGQKMLEVLQRIGCKVILFVQSLKSDVKEYKGISIISAEEYFKGNYDCYIFIAINNSDAVDSIYDLFLEQKYDNS